jgi:Protein of unknown function (DUF2971)
MQIPSRQMMEAEMDLRFLARANPPPILFRYRGTSKYVIEEISKQQLYAATSQELNDPFECRAPVVWNVDLMKDQFIKHAPAFGISPEKAAEEFDSSRGWGMNRLLEKWEATRAETRIVCFSAKPNSIRMWSYYAQAHEGICVGYDTAKRPFWVAQKVKYQNPDMPFDVVAASQSDPTEIAANITCRKSSEWEFEEEYRVASNLGDTRLIPFEASAIKEIRFGARMKPEFKDSVMEAVKCLPHRPVLIQMGCDFDRFILTDSIL